MSNKSVIESLCSKILKASDAYYNKQPIMSDEEYDELVERLQVLDPTNKVLSLVGFPVPADSVLQKVKHEMPMGSLNKVKTEKEFLKWVKKIGLSKFIIQEKLDGISASLCYRMGRLKYAATRGEGLVGEDITHHVRLMKNAPLYLPDVHKMTEFHVRGEIILSKKSFEEYFASKGYANPRNTVSGFCQKKEADALVRHFQILYYDVASPNTDFNFASEAHKLGFLRDLALH
jgi:DNA ligase (NAD+)